jgi:hypothetical protein
VFKRFAAFLCILTLFFIVGCSAIQPAETPQVLIVSEQSLTANAGILQSIAPHMNQIDAEFASFPHPAKLGRDYFDAVETDQMEGLLFRFLANHSALWDMVDAYGGLNEDFPDNETDTKAHVISLTAILLMANHMAFAVAEFADEPIAIKQMNEAYPRSEILFGTYDQMREDVSSPELLATISAAKEYCVTEMSSPDSQLARLAARDSAYGEMIGDFPALFGETEKRLQAANRNISSHRAAERLARKDVKKQHKTLYKMQAVLFKSVSRLKNPSAHVVVFTPAQKQQIFSLLEPGDLIITYTAGYMSDVFIPGAFKHGITYIGLPEDRELLDLDAEKLLADERYNIGELKKNLQKSQLPNGAEANMIEAVAEGVIFNNLEHIMDTHINRMLILRPNLSNEERSDALLEVYSYLGYAYDFRFDFSDASKQVCTEVIYRAIDGKGEIEFPLVVRAGHETLSADDIANYHLSTSAFEFVLLAESLPDSKENAATIYVGTEGEEQLQALMDSVKE